MGMDLDMDLDMVMGKSARGRKARVLAMVVVGVIALGVCAAFAFRAWGPRDDGPPQKDATVNAAGRLEVIESLVATLNQFYGYPEKAALIERGLRAQLTKGDFDKLIGDTRALVIDLRRMHGGDPETVMPMASYLFDQPTHLNDIYWRDGDRVETRWTTAQVTGRRDGASRPVVILTSAETFSAGEDFAYALKHAGRAVLIGATTGGGAHPGSRRRLTAHFMMNVPTGRAINPVTKTDWEGVGVVPDIAVPAKQALGLGQAKLLQQLLAGESDPQWRRRLTSCLKELD
jgi:C-terminal processing protease CtpA/Prc